MLNYLYIHSIEFILILTPSVMKDLLPRRYCLQKVKAS